MPNESIEFNARVAHMSDKEVNWNTKTTFIPENGELIVYEPD